MAKYNIKRRHSKTLDLSLGKRYKPLSKNIFDIGGLSLPKVNSTLNGGIFTMTPEQATAAGFTPANNSLAGMAQTDTGTGGGKGFNMSGFMDKAGSVVSGITSIVDSSMKNAQIADTSGIESDIKNLQEESFSEATDSNSLLDAYNNINFQKDDYTMKDVRGASGGELAMNTLSAVGSGAAAGASVGGPWGAVAGAAVGLGGALTGLFVGNKKARERAELLNLAAKNANKVVVDNFDYQAGSVIQDNARNAMKSAYAKDGGAIHIKKKNRGKFTASAKRAEMGVQEYARHVLANKDRYSSTLVKRANFARNAAGWKHALGGYMMENNTIDTPLSQTHGGDFSNGVTLINNGGTHEQNPYEGVPIGIAPDGQPNLVEEGEVIYNDYVFSNRLHPTDKEIKESKLPKKYKGYTFALIAEDMSKESAERPNDPISKRGLEDSLGKLAMIQEQQRMRKGKRGTQQMMAFGGRKYAGNLDLDPVVTDKKREMPSIIDKNAYANPINMTQDDRRIRSFLDSVPEMESEENINALDAAFQREALAGLTYPSVSPSTATTKAAKPASTSSKSAKPLSTSSRYAPVIGSAIGALQSVFQKPDYTNSDLILNAVDNLSRARVSPRLINNYLNYKPLDRNYYLNQLQGQAGATRRAIMNSGSNPGQVMAGLLAADYNAQQGVADTLMKMDMYNEQQRQAIEQFNRGTDQYNSGAGMNADAQNAQLAQNRDKMRLSGITTAAGMREAADTALANSKSMNYTNFFDNLGAIGQENFVMNQIQSNPSLYYHYTRPGNGTISYGAKGGRMLTKRNRRRR